MFDLLMSDVRLTVDRRLLTAHSVLKLSIGFAIAAFIACTLTVINAINKTNTPAPVNIHHDILMR